MSRTRQIIRPLSLALFLAFLIAAACIVRGHLLEQARSPSPEAEACLNRMIHDMYAARDAKPPQVLQTADDNVATRLEPDGRVRWSHDMGGYFRSWECVVDAGKVVLPYDGGLVALDDRTGDVAWTSAGPALNLFAADNMVIAVSSPWAPGCKREIVARSLRDGSVVWSVPEVETRWVGSIMRSGDILFVRYEIGIREGATTGVDLRGNVRFHLKEYVFSARETDSDFLVVTSHRVARLTKAGAVVWEVLQSDWNSNWPFDWGETVPIAGTDALVCFHGPISNSGAEVWRLDAATGRVRWKALCDPLPNVMHSEYQHSVRLVPLTEEVVVVSRGSSGSFVEVLALSDGKRLNRVELPVTWLP